MVTVVTTVLMVATGFVCATWNHFFANPGIPAWQILLPSMTAAFIVVTVVSMRSSNLGLRFTYQISAIWLGVLNLVFFAACLAWMASLVIALLSFHFSSESVASLCFLAALLVSAYGFINASWLRVTRLTVHLENLPANWNGGTLALVTDMHLGNFRGAGFSRRVVNKLNQLRPRAVLISGDLFDGTSGDLEALVAPWKKLNPQTAAYFVTGNHEEFGDRQKFLEAVKGAGIRVLENEMVENQGLQIVGVHDAESGDPDLFRKTLRDAGVDRGRASILLAHQPGNLSIAEEEGISLQVSGHTHGGQMWPWTLLAARVHGRFNHGLNRLGRLLVLTSYGVGTWGAPMRLGTHSEMVLIQLAASKT